MLVAQFFTGARAWIDLWVCAVMPSPQKKQRLAGPRPERAAVEVEVGACMWCCVGVVEE